MFIRARAGLLTAAVLVLSACTTGSSPAASAPSVAPAASGSAPASSAAASPVAGGLLDKVLKAGVLVVSTDPNYAPQSGQKPDRTYEGFDIDVATEVAKRLGVTVKFVTPDWAIITAGS